MNKSSLFAVTTADQTVAIGDYVRFDLNKVQTGCSIKHPAGSNVVELLGAGLYSGAFNADFTITATGPVTFQLLRNGEVVAGAEATVQATADEPIHISFDFLELVRPSCAVIDNKASLQVTVSAEGTINTASLQVIKQA